MQNRRTSTLHIVLIIRLLIVFLLFTICRALFLLANASHFPGIGWSEVLTAFLAGLRFDLSAIILLNGLFILLFIIPFAFRYNRSFQRFLFYLFVCTNSLFLLPNCIDLAYYQFTLKRTTWDVFTLMGMGSDLTTLLPRFIIDFWYVTVAWVTLVILMVVLYRKTPTPRKYSHATGWLYYGKHGLLFLCFLALAIFGSRGGFQLKPINMITAGQYVQAQYTPIVLNTPFTLIRSMEKQHLEDPVYFDEEKLNHIYSPVIHLHDTADFKPMNVMVIILESFSAEYLSSFNEQTEGYAPFLDSLAQHSLTLPRAFANGRKSIEAIPAILAGLPTLMDDPYISGYYGGNRINSIASLLNPFGYTSAFFHGGTNGTMGFDDFISISGFDRYYGRHEYDNDEDYDGHWGIYDEEFLQFVCKTIDHMQQPFVTSVFTLSSHHPYHIPDRYQTLFKKGSLKIHQSIHYTDYALKCFFGAARQTDWFNQTLFVITADHTFQGQQDYYNSRVGTYAVPLMFYCPALNLKGIDSTVAQQTDILPSIMDLLNYPQPFVAFGSSVFDKSRPHVALSYIAGSYQMINDHYALVHNGSDIMAYYDLTIDPLQQNNYIWTADSLKIESKMETMTKAIVQQYNSRMIHNRLIIE